MNRRWPSSRPELEKLICEKGITRSLSREGVLVREEENGLVEHVLRGAL